MLKRFTIITVISLALVILIVFVANAGAQDKKDVTKEAKKQAAKVLGTEKDGCATTDCAKKCSEQCTESECLAHDPAKCSHEKCDGALKPGSKECLEKHAKGECKDKKTGACCPTDQAKKQDAPKKK